MKKSKSRYSVSTYMYMLILFMCSVNILSIYAVSTTIINYTGLINKLAYGLVSIVALTTLIKKRGKRLTTISTLVFLFLFYILFQIMFFSDAFGDDLFNGTMSFLLLFIFIETPQRNDKLIYYLSIFFFFFSVFIYIFFRIVAPVADLLPPQNLPQYHNSIYYMVCVFPFILCGNKRVITYSALLVLLFSIFISTKRGAVVALAVAISSYYIIETIIKQRKFNTLIGVIIAVIAGLYLFSYTNQNWEISVFDKFEDTTGGERAEIASKALDKFMDFSPMQTIFGYGPNGVSKVLKVSAHNDYIEVLFDYGLFGVLMYLIILYQLSRYSIRMLKNRFQYTSAYTFAIVAFVVMSFYTHLIFILKYCLLFMAFFGMMIKKYRDESLILMGKHTV